VTGSLGELETRILLEQYIDADLAEALGPKLKGSDYRIDEVKKAEADHRMTLRSSAAEPQASPGSPRWSRHRRARQAACRAWLPPTAPPAGR
jgi:hypothetical protein